MSTDNAKTKAHGAESASTARLDFPTWDEAISGITDSRFVGHQKIPRLNTNCTRDGARIMYDRLYVLMKSNVQIEPPPRLFAEVGSNAGLGLGGLERKTT